MATAQHFFLSEIRHHPVFHYEGHRIGVLADLVVQQREDCGQVLGLVVTVGTIRVFVPATGLAALSPERIELAYSTVDLEEYTRSSNDVLLVEDVLDHSLVDHVTSQRVGLHRIRCPPPGLAEAQPQEPLHTRLA